MQQDTTQLSQSVAKVIRSPNKKKINLVQSDHWVTTEYY